MDVVRGASFVSTVTSIMGYVTGERILTRRIVLDALPIILLGPPKAALPLVLGGFIFVSFDDGRYYWGHALIALFYILGFSQFL